MKTIILILLAALLTAGCSFSADGGDSVQDAPASTAATTVDVLTPEALDAAVRTAAQLLVDSPGVEGTRLGYDENGELRLTSWTDWRANGDVASASVSSQGPAGLVEVGDTALLMGSRMVGDNVVAAETWTAVDPSSPDPTATAFFGVDLVAMAAGSTLDGLADLDTESVVVSSEPGPAGGTRWRMVVPLGDGTVTREWLVDGSGYLRAWTWAISPGMVVGSDSTVEVHFNPLTDPDPIVLPQEGAEMDLDGLGFPADLPTP